MIRLQCIEVASSILTRAEKIIPLSQSCFFLPRGDPVPRFLSAVISLDLIWGAHILPLGAPPKCPSGALGRWCWCNIDLTRPIQAQLILVTTSRSVLFLSWCTHIVSHLERTYTAAGITQVVHCALCRWCWCNIDLGHFFCTEDKHQEIATLTRTATASLRGTHTHAQRPKDLTL